MPNIPLLDQRILVIDGDIRRGEVVRRMLSEMGVEHVSAAQVAEAASSVLMTRRFDLVIGRMDDSAVDMLDFARALRRSESCPSRETPILLITETLVRSELLTALDSGITGFVAGDLTAERLRGQILSVLQSYGPF